MSECVRREDPPLFESCQRIIFLLTLSACHSLLFWDSFWYSFPATKVVSASRMKPISIPPVEQIPPNQVRQAPIMNYQQFLCPSRQVPSPRVQASPPASRRIPSWAPPASTRHISPFSSLGHVQPQGRNWSLAQVLPPPVIVFPPSYSRVFPMAKIL